MNKAIKKSVLTISASMLFAMTANHNLLAAANNYNNALPASHPSVEAYSSVLLAYSIQDKNPATIIASKFVRSAELYKSLSVLLLDSVKEDKLVEQAISVHGFSNVKKTVIQDIKTITGLFRHDWDALLSSIYGKQFGEEILKSILEEGEKSPHFAKFVATQKNSQTDNQLISSNVFKDARKELISKLENSFTSRVSVAK